MRKIILLILISIILQSCGSDDFFSSGKFYKMVDKKKKIELNMTFLKDSTIAFNMDTLKTCGWNFMKFSKNKNGIFLINKEALDTTYLKIENGKIVFQSSKDKFSFNEIDFSSKKVDSIYKVINKVKSFSDKKIIFTCDININEVAYFYDNAVQEIKSNLKNPNSAKFKEVYIHNYDDYKKEKSDIKVVSIEVEATNSFGGFTIDTFYVYFTPNEKNSRNYTLKFSDSPLYKSILDEMNEFEELEQKKTTPNSGLQKLGFWS